MPDELRHQVARVGRAELSALPSYRTEIERGKYLWRLLRDKGIDPSRMFTAQYFPHRRCWLLIQEASQKPPQVGSVPTDHAAKQLLAHMTAELRRTAMAVFSASAARSSYFASFGCPYQLPARAEETTPTKLARLLGGRAADFPRVHFDSEGGWRLDASEE